MENQTILQWHSPEHHFDKKAKDWYWILGVITVAIAVLAFYFNDFLFGVFIIVAGLTIGLLSYKETKVVEIRLVPKGIIFGKSFYPWLSYQSFWIDDENVHGPRLLMRPTSTFMPLALIPINDELDLNDLRDVLLEFMEEEYLQESVLHRWFDKLLAK